MNSAPVRTPTEVLNTPVQYVKGIGPHRAGLLAKLELRTIADLLFFFPRDYQQLRPLCAPAELQHKQEATVCGTVEEVELRKTAPGKCVLGVLVLLEGGAPVRALWFNQPYFKDRFKRGGRVLLSGVLRRRGLHWEMSHPRVQNLGPEEQPSGGQVFPVYGLTDGLNQSTMRRIVQTAVSNYTELLEEVFPTQFLEKHGLWGIHRALPQVHAPDSRESLDRARRRFIYQEMLVMQLALAFRRDRLRRESRATPLPVSAKIDSRIRRLFPFECTSDQNAAISEITRDMARETPMNRLLQGDVGNGKTVVAEYAMLLTVAHGHQAVMMAPTDVLARQHAMTLQQDLAQSKVRIGLLTGTLSAAVRRETLAAITAGDIDLIVGTQAVVQEGVRFARLGLVIIDEQHRFGVLQRARLKQAGRDPHYLVMTATPIPRTVSMTVFGDLEVSALRSAPPGRQTVHTYVAEEAQRQKWWEFFRKKLREGRQGYVITPLVDDSETVMAQSAEQAFESLVNGELDAFRIGLVHGKQPAATKDATMDAFRRGDLQVLVATSVVEVGVNVPNATVMTIENGERFGLAQLHQLRGRISRGIHPGYLCVFAPRVTSDAQERLDVLCRTNDGFELAELDFQLRGPGDLFGTRQHGLPPLRIADLQRDSLIVDEARRDAQSLIATDPQLSDPGFARVRRMVIHRYGQALELGDVG